MNNSITIRKERTNGDKPSSTLNSVLWSLQHYLAKGNTLFYGHFNWMVHPHPGSLFSVSVSLLQVLPGEECSLEEMDPVDIKCSEAGCRDNNARHLPRKRHRPKRIREVNTKRREITAEIVLIYFFVLFLCYSFTLKGIKFTLLKYIWVRFKEMKCQFICNLYQGNVEMFLFQLYSIFFN